MHLLCDGSVEPGTHGSWKGHVYPGAAFILWGSWWAWCTLVYFLWQSPRRPYGGRAWYPFPARWVRYLEPVLKVAVPVFAMNMELWLDHRGHEWQSLYCPPGTKFAGRFALSNINNWQHALSYPAFMLSGIVDLAGAFVPLPAGASQAVLGSAFAASSFIMITHEKHEPQDKAVHWLLAVSMAVTTGAVFLEMLRRRSVLAGLFKSVALVLQGAWLVKIASIEFEGRPQWSTDYPGGAMFASTVFTFIATIVIAAAFAAYVALALLRQSGWFGLERLIPTDGEEELSAEAQLVPSPRHRPRQHHQYDSAHHSDDNDGEVLLPAGTAKYAGSAGVAPLHIQHSRSDTADVYV